MKVFRDLFRLRQMVEEAYSVQDARQMMLELESDLQTSESCIAVDRLLTWIDEANAEITKDEEARKEDIENSESEEEAVKNADYWAERISEKRMVILYANQLKEDIKAME